MLATVGKIIDEAARRAGSIQSGESIFSLTNNPIYRSAAGRNVIGAYAELNLPFQRDWVLEAGLRGDVWLTGGTSQRALEPRGLLRFHANDWLSLHAAFGLAYQPAVFLIPLPGVSDVALDRGLQRAIQSELGVRFELPWAFSLENKLFAHFYKDMLSVDAIDPRDFECKTDGGAGAPLPPTLGGEAGQLPEGVALPMLPEGVTPPTSLPGGVSCKERQGLGRISAYSYGGEWLLRRASSEPISGWLSYTLSKADGHANNGKALTPNFDVRHVANLVFQWRISKGWNVALRGMAQSGRFPLGAGTLTDPRERERLPPFFRGDLQVSHTWQKRWGALRVALDWLNFTFQREPLAWRCPGSAPQRQCKVQHVGFPITVPLLGVRATF
jgi:hypothetical protein